MFPPFHHAHLRETGQEGKCAWTIIDQSLLSLLKTVQILDFGIRRAMMMGRRLVEMGALATYQS
jgi:hypothetical protein